MAQANVVRENEAKEKENLFSQQLMENSLKLELTGAKINMLQESEKDLEQAKERVSQSQHQRNSEQEKTTQLEMQIRAETALESVGDPVEQSIQSGATLEKSRGKIVETEGNSQTHERELTLTLTDSEEKESSDKLLMSPFDFKEIKSEGMLY